MEDVEVLEVVGEDSQTSTEDHMPRKPTDSQLQPTPPLKAGQTKSNNPMPRKPLPMKLDFQVLRILQL